MKRAVALLISVILFVSMLVLGVVSRMQAQQSQQGQQQPCTPATLQGIYGVLATGFFQFGAFTASQPFTQIGNVSFDGVRNVNGQFTFSSNGNINTNSFQSTYTVNPDCTGTFTSPAGSVVLRFVIVAQGHEFLAIQTVDGTVVSAIGIKQ